MKYNLSIKLDLLLEVLYQASRSNGHKEKQKEIIELIKRKHSLSSLPDWFMELDKKLTKRIITIRTTAGYALNGTEIEVMKALLRAKEVGGYVVCENQEEKNAIKYLREEGLITIKGKKRLTDLGMRVADCL